ncbi:MAG: hypothetical protein D6730_12265 [Bacteroidetes bacterium]|nr:MAG: hypothetical protein D6730_12265 [Bacteroidota bacterium]
MSQPQFDRNKLLIKPLAARRNRVQIERDHVPPTRPPGNTSPEFTGAVAATVQRIRQARQLGASVILSMGAHTIKNGMAPTLIRLMEEGWLTHLATNGAGIIHDWEFAFQGESSEHVQANVQRGEFGIWEETGRYLNLALLVGAFEGKGYGESVGSMIEQQGLKLPSETELLSLLPLAKTEPERLAAALDLLGCLRAFELPPGWMPISFPYRHYSVQAAAWRLGVPFTGHPMFGHDIIYTHPMSRGAAIGRTAERDFLAFAQAVNGLEGGVYLSVGSAVMSPMIFEKSLSMAQNLHLQAGKPITNHFMMVVDLAPGNWDWARGEPPESHPAYYLRYLKTFSRMGGHMRYLSADNRDFLLAIYQQLAS